MLTRGAAGPPDVAIPTRLVTSGPSLLSLRVSLSPSLSLTHAHTHSLYIVHSLR